MYPFHGSLDLTTQRYPVLNVPAPVEDSSTSSEEQSIIQSDADTKKLGEGKQTCVMPRPPVFREHHSSRLHTTTLITRESAFFIGMYTNRATVATKNSLKTI